MVAVIKTSGNIKNALHYNEQKVTQDVAELIHTKNYLKDAQHLSFSDKINTIKKLTSLNNRTKLNGVHISLNFDLGENLSKNMLRDIADTYMRGIGFENQPYLVYQHRDAGHPHIHIVTTNIQANGKGIKMFNIGRNQSEKTRKEIEKEFNLVVAQSKQRKQVYEIKPVSLQKVQYGKSATKRAITNVLDAVFSSYKYASLPQLNAVLRQYNILADRGSEQSRTYKNNGLVYRVLDDKGQKIGVPVKASVMYNKPGWAFLQEKFSQNEGLKHKYKIRVKNAVEMSFARKPGQSLSGLAAALQKERINLVFRQNEQGIIYGLTYVDNQQKCVFNGSELGKQYSANAIQERCALQEKLNQRPLPSPSQEINHRTQPPLIVESGFPNNPVTAGLLKQLVQSEEPGSVSPDLFEEIRRRKRKKLRQ